MNPTPPPSAAQAADGPVCCNVAAVGRVRAPIESLPELRRRPGPLPADALPATFLKNADEQTVFALAAVYHAIHDYKLDAARFGRWAVIASPSKIGRTAMAQALPRFREEGAWGMSPHLIPNRSLHCVSGAISCALRIHGPNVGVGDGPAEGLLAAAALFARQQVDGVWMVLTTFDPELVPNRDGLPDPGTHGIGLALALVPTLSERQGLRLRIERTAAVSPPVARRTALDLRRLDVLLDAPVEGTRGAPLQDLGPHGMLHLWVEGQLPGVRRDQPHAAAVPTPHAVGQRTSSPSTNSVEALR